MTLDAFEQWAVIAASIVTSLGFPAALFSYRQTKRAQQREEKLTRESQQAMADDEAYSRLHSDYNGFLVLVMQFPELDLADEPLSDPPPLTDMQRMQAVSLFNIFLSLIERAFLLYGTTSEELKIRQWEGWRAYAVQMLRRPNIAELFDIHGHQYDGEFLAAIDEWHDKATD